MAPSTRRPRGRRRFIAILLVALVLLAVGSATVRALRGHGRTPQTVGPLSPARTDQRLGPSPSLRSAPPSPRASMGSRGALVIHGAGDVSLDPSYIVTYRTHGYGYAWSGLEGLFRRDDLTVVNVECPVSRIGSRWPGKDYSFRGDPAALPAMREAGVDVGNLANNHQYDYGPDALVDSRKNLLRAGIAPVGAGRNEGEAVGAAIFHVKGWTIAVVGLDQVLDPDPEEVATADKPGTAAGHDFDAMLAAVRAAKARADLVAVDIHWGVELDTTPRDFQVTQAHRMIDAGADVFFGGHSHRLQPLEVYRGRPIFYSLGNFVWPNFSRAGSTTAVAEIRVTPGGLFSARLVPAFITSPGHPVLLDS
jgi:hypothetical protein